MFSKFSDLRYKEVINVNTGHRLGYICDAEIDMKDGKIISLIVPGPSRFGGVLGREDDYILPWSCINRIGEDIILVDLPTPVPRERGERRPLM
ncbi:MAG: YlmC/YmxH family sporulation protein [Oscillospiraceae bacterium]